MLFVIIPLGLLLLMAVGDFLSRNEDKEKFVFGTGIIMVASSLLTLYLLIGSINQITGYNEYATKQAKYKNINQKIMILENQKNDILNQIRAEISKYMNYESQQLQQLKLDGLMFVCNQYPDLKANQLIKENINYINNLNQQVNAMRMAQIDLKTNLDAVNSNIWYVFSFKYWEN